MQEVTSIRLILFNPGIVYSIKNYKYSARDKIINNCLYIISKFLVSFNCHKSKKFYVMVLSLCINIVSLFYNITFKMKLSLL